MCLVDRAIKMGTNHTVEDELCFLLSLFVKNGCTKRFINKAIENHRARGQEIGPIKKPV